jgi:hypothetical protein
MIELAQYIHMVVEPRSIITPFLSDLDLLKLQCSTATRAFAAESTPRPLSFVRVNFVRVNLISHMLTEGSCAHVVL